jgi:hypothetical protein
MSGGIMQRRLPVQIFVLFAVVACADASALSAPFHKVDPAKLQGKEFKTLAAAKSACGTSPVVWVNIKGVVFHTQKSRWFGHSKTGIYSCRNAAKAAGFWQSKY